MNYHKRQWFYGGITILQMESPFYRGIAILSTPSFYLHYAKNFYRKKYLRQTFWAWIQTCQTDPISRYQKPLYCLIYRVYRIRIRYPLFKNCISSASCFFECVSTLEDGGDRLNFVIIATEILCFLSLFRTKNMFRGQDAWRRHHLLTGCWKNPLPGLGTAIVIFTGYCIVEAGFKYVTGRR